MAHDDTPITQQLIQRAQHGDGEAISIIYQTYLEPIYRYIAYRVGTEVDVEDLTMEVFLRMIRYLPRYEYTGVPFEAWLYRIAATQVAGFYRKRGRRPQQVDLADNLREPGTLPETRLIEQQEHSQVREALRRLNEDEQEVLILRFVERKSHREVATILDKSESAVKSIQHRALLRLARLLGSEEKIRHYLRGDHD
jgi:RNA polymerase sigma-70 factor, ECF subfamily